MADALSAPSISSESAPWPWGRAAPLLFATGLALYLVLQLAVVVLPIERRPYPPSGQDSAGYILKAAEMRSCFRQRCAALEDLRAQVTAPTADAEVTWQRAREHHRVFHVYHPLHSLLLLALEAAGLDWERALNWLSIAGALVIGLGIAWFLGVLWGPAPAGLALALLSVVVFPGWHGVHWVVPGNMALGVGFLAWAAVLRGGRAAQMLPLLVAAMLALHPVGRVYAAVALFLQLMVMERTRRADWWALGAGVAVMALFLILPQLVERPDLTYRPHTPPEGWNWWGGFRGNLAIAGEVVADWAARFGGWPVVLLLAAAGLAALERARCRGALAVGLLLGGVTAASLAYVLPRYPAELFHRVWIPLVVFLTGAIAAFAWRWLNTTAVWARHGAPADRPRWRHWLTGDFRTGQGMVWHGFLGALLLYALVANAATGPDALSDKIDHMTQWRYHTIDRAQPARVLARLAPGERVLYLDALPLYLYLTDGGLDRGTVFYPAIAGTPLERDWLARDRNIAYAVALDRRFPGYFRVGSKRRLEVAADGVVDWSAARIRLDSSGREGTLEVAVDGRPARTLALPDGGGGWLRLGAAAGRGRTLSLGRPGAGPAVRITGFRLGPAGPHRWPWDQGAVFTSYRRLPPLAAELRGAGPWTLHRVTTFDAQALLPAACRSLGVADDRGDLVAIRVACGAPRG